MQVYCGENVRDWMPNAPNKAVFEDSDAVYDGVLDSGDWVEANLKSTSGDPKPATFEEIRSYFDRVQDICSKAGVEAPQNLLKLLSMRANKSVFAPSPAISPSLKRFESAIWRFL